MTAKRPALPPSWYQSLAETAAELGTHPERLLYYADAGLILPAALIPKALLPVSYPGPSPYLVVRLDIYRDMPWVPDAGDMVAPLIGSHRAYQVDGHAYTNLDLDGAGVLIRRSELVFTCDQIEALQEACKLTKPSHPAKSRMQQRIMGMLVAERWPKAGAYTVAEAIVTAFQLHGLSISNECAAGHVKESRSEFEAAATHSKMGAENQGRLERAA